MSTPLRLRSSTLLETRDGTPANKDARLFNCIVEKNGDELDFLKRPGYTSLFSADTGTGQGAFLATTADGGSQIFSIVDNQMYATNEGVSTTYTTIGTTPGMATQAPQAVLWFNDLWWCLGISTTDGTVYSSPDGAIWTAVQATPAYNVGLAGGGRRIQFAACVFAGRMWVSGGINGVTNDELDEVYSSVDGVTWTLATNAPGWTGRSGHHMVSYANKLWVFGSSVSGGGPLRDVWYSSDGISWTQATATATWTARYRTSAFVLNGKMWIIGGTIAGGGGETDDCYSTTDGITWTLETSSPGWTARGQMGTAVFNNYVWLSLGFDGSSYYRDLWRSADGVTWTQVTSNITIVGTGAAASSDFSTNNGYWPNNGSMQTDGETIWIFGAYNGTWADTVYSGVTSQTSVTITTGTNAQLASGGLYDFSQTYDRSEIAIKNTAGAWVYTISGQTLVKVTDVDYPAVTVRGLVYLDGTFYVMDTNGTIYGSDVNDFASWSALNFLSAQSEPDGGVCLIKYNQYVVAFGNYTTEFFYNAGNATGSPLSPVQNSQLLIGCVNGDCVSQAQSSVFFPAKSKALGQSSNPRMFIAELSGMAYQRVSTPNVDRILNADGLDGAWSLFFVCLGHPCYMLTMPTTGYSVVFDLAVRQWYIFNKQTAGSAKSVTALTCTEAYSGATIGVATATSTTHGFSDGDPVTIAGATPSGYNGTFNITYVDANTFTYPTSTVLASATGTITATGSTAGIFPALTVFNYGNTQIFQNQLDGAIYTMSDTTYTDNTLYIDTKLRSESFDKGLSQDGNSQNKFLPWIDLISDKTATSTNAYIRWTDDDYQTYSKYRPVDISLKRSRLSRCGAFVRRAFEVRHTASSAFRMQGLDLGLEQGSE